MTPASQNQLLRDIRTKLNDINTQLGALHNVDSKLVAIESELTTLPDIKAKLGTPGLEGLLGEIKSTLAILQNIKGTLEQIERQSNLLATERLLDEVKGKLDFIATDPSALPKVKDYLQNIEDKLGAPGTDGILEEIKGELGQLGNKLDGLQGINTKLKKIDRKLGTPSTGLEKLLTNIMGTLGDIKGSPSSSTTPGTGIEGIVETLDKIEKHLNSDEKTASERFASWVSGPNRPFMFSIIISTVHVLKEIIVIGLIVGVLANVVASRMSEPYPSIVRFGVSINGNYPPDIFRNIDNSYYLITLSKNDEDLKNNLLKAGESYPIKIYVYDENGTEYSDNIECIWKDIKDKKDCNNNITPESGEYYISVIVPAQSKFRNAKRLEITFGVTP